MFAWEPEKPKMEKTTNNPNAQPEEKEEMYYLKSGDVFTVEAVKIIKSKMYANEIAKVLCDEKDQMPAAVVFSSAANIVPVLKEPWAIGEQFVVVQKGVFNNHPVLAVQSMNKEIQEKISRVLF